MPGFGDIVQKAFYLGIGLASYAGEKAGVRLGELRSQAQKLADEMVARGEMTTEEAKRFVEELMQQAQESQPQQTDANSQSKEPRRIEILTEDEESATTSNQQPDVENLRQQVLGLQDELQRLKRQQ